MLDGVKTLLVRIGGDIAGAHASFNQFNQSLDRVGFNAAKVGAALTGAYLAMEKLANRGGEVINVGQAFSRQVGDQESALMGLRGATHGLISDFDLMVGFNRAATLGAASTKEEYADLARTAIALGKALGQDAAFALEALSLGIGRQSKLILDNLGLIVSVSEANEKYARTLNKTAGELTDAEKREAFRTAALEAARAKVAELGEAAATAADDAVRLRVEIRNLVDEAAKLTASSGYVQDFFEGLSVIVHEGLGGGDFSREAVLGSLANLPDDLELLQRRAIAVRQEFVRLNYAVGEVPAYARGSRDWKASLEDLKDTAAALSYLEGRIQSLKASQASAAGSGPAGPSFAPPGLGFTWENARMLVEAIEKTEEELGKARFDLALSKTADEADNLSLSIQELEGRLLSLKRLAGSWGGLGYVQSFLLPRPGGDPMARMPGSVPTLGASPVSARSTVSATVGDLSLLQRATKDLTDGFTNAAESFLDPAQMGANLAAWGIQNWLSGVTGALFGENTRKNALEAALERNREALEANTSALMQGFVGSTPGSSITAALSGITAYLDANPWTGHLKDKQLDNALKDFGFSLAELKALAADLGLEWVDTSTFLRMFQRTLEEITSEDLVGTLAGQLSMLGKEWELLDISDPQEKMDSIMEKLSGWLSEGLFSQLQGVDWAVPGDFLKELLGSIWAGTFDLAQLEGIGLEEFINILLQLEAFGDEVGNATEELSSLTSTLRNAPSGFKVARARFNATLAEARPIRTDPPGGGGTGPGGITVTGPIYIDGANKDGKEIWAEMEREAYRQSARGGTSFLNLTTGR